MIEEAESILKHLGFTEYESKTYIALIKYGPLTAEKISKFAKIPLPRVYDTMASLARRGLVFVVNTRPQTFRVNEPGDILELLKEDMQKSMGEKMKKVEEAVPKLMKAISSIERIAAEEEEHEDVIAYIRKKANREKIWFDLQEKAKQRVDIIGGDISWVDRTAPLVKKMLKRGVKYKIMWSKNTPEAMRNAQKAKKIGMDVRYSSDVGIVRGMIVDNDQISLVEKKGGVPSGGGVLDVDEVATITIRNEILADVFRTYFDILWKRSTPVERMRKPRRITS